MNDLDIDKYTAKALRIALKDHTRGAEEIETKELVELLRRRSVCLYDLGAESDAETSAALMHEAAYRLETMLAQVDALRFALGNARRPL